MFQSPHSVSVEVESVNVFIAGTDFFDYYYFCSLLAESFAIVLTASVSSVGARNEFLIALVACTEQCPLST